MKRFFILVLAWLLILSLVSCAQNQPANSSFEQTTNNPNTSNTTVTVNPTTTISSTSTERKTTTSKVITTTVPHIYHILSKKTIKTTYLLSTKQPNDLNNHCLVRTLSEQENATLNGFLDDPNVLLVGEELGLPWIKHIPGRPNEYALIIEFMDDTCMILALHFDNNNKSTYWIAAAETNAPYNEEAKYIDLKYIKGIAKLKFAEYLFDIIYNYNS